MTPLHSRRILYLVPDMFDTPGGIARYGRLVCQTILNAGIELYVISLLDLPESTETQRNALENMNYFPCAGSKTRFVKRALEISIFERPPVVMVGHVHLAPVGLIVSRMIGAKLITSIHGIDVWHRLSLPRRCSLQHSDLILSVSQFTIDKATAANELDPAQIGLLPNAIADESRPQVQAPSDINQPVLLTVSRISHLEEYKGHEYVIRAVARLRRKFPNLIYNIVGDGTGRAKLEKLRADLNLNKSVRFLGRVAEDELDYQYQNATVFIMPSRGEGFGIVFLEAMARGLPVICGNLDASPEVVVDGETGLVVDPCSVDEICEAVSLLLEDKERRSHMGRRGVEHVCRNYTSFHFSERLLAHIDRQTADLWTQFS